MQLSAALAKGRIEDTKKQHNNNIVHDNKRETLLSSNSHLHVINSIARDSITIKTLLKVKKSKKATPKINNDKKNRQPQATK